MPALLIRPRIPKPDDPELIEAFCSAIADGQPTDTAATAAGISHRTADDWIKQGNEALAAEPTEPGAELGEQSSHALFALAVKQAEHHFVSENLGYVRKARQGDKGWLPAMTLLERRRPDAFGRFQRVEVASTSVTVSITAQLPPGAAEALLTMGQAEQDRATKFLPPGGGTEPQSPDSDQA